MWRTTAPTANPWNALWAMLVGFFMILVDATIVSVANPAIMDKLGASYDSVIWVTSAYLLAYAVPLLVAGRLGDRFGPKNLYLLGLTVFTVASLWCGLADSIGMLIVARVVQGRRGRAAHTADAVDDHPHLPRRATWCRDERVGRDRGRGDTGRSAGRWTVGRRAGLAVDLFRQRARRHRRLGPGPVADSATGHPEAGLRSDRYGAVGDRHVHDRVRPAGGTVARLGTVGVGHDRRRHLLHGRVPVSGSTSIPTTHSSRCRSSATETSRCPTSAWPPSVSSLPR